MHLNEIDLNLLRLFDAVYRERNVSRAAELLALTQPAGQPGLTRLRALINDPLVRARRRRRAAHAESRPPGRPDTAWR